MPKQDVKAAPKKSTTRKTPSRATKPSKAKTPRSAPRVAKNSTAKSKTAHTATHAKAKQSKTKQSKPAKASSLFNLSADEKQSLLELISQYIESRKHTFEGLRSLYGIDKILDKYNQRFPTIIDKFDAIVRYGMEKDPNIIHAHFYTLVEGRSKDENDLYLVLADIGNHKIKFADAKKKVEMINADIVK